MISYMKGIVAEKDGYGLVLEVDGIGYALCMSTKSLAALPAVGGTTQVWTYLQVKEDGLALYGFADTAEKEMFERLVGVSGIGPKIAIAALSSFSAEGFAQAVAAQDITAISTVPGIGKKTAQRIVLELQGVLQMEDASAGAAHTDSTAPLAEASEALLSMGFSSQEISTALKGCTEKDVEGAIRYALKGLGGA